LQLHQTRDTVFISHVSLIGMAISVLMLIPLASHRGKTSGCGGAAAGGRRWGANEMRQQQLGMGSMADYCPIASTLGYVLSPDREKVLLVHRVRRDEDEHMGKYNGLGGHLEAYEDVATGIIREIREEAGIECTALTLRGTINWNEFGPRKRDWLGFIFLIPAFEGIPYDANEDGPLEWIPLDGVMNLPMWEGDRFFLPLVFDDDPRPFHGHMRYDGETPTGWTYVRM